jgi:hypothetical protein
MVIQCGNCAAPDESMIMQGDSQIIRSNSMPDLNQWYIGIDGRCSPDSVAAGVALDDLHLLVSESGELFERKHPLAYFTRAAAASRKIVNYVVNELKLHGSETDDMRKICLDISWTVQAVVDAIYQIALGYWFTDSIEEYAVSLVELIDKIREFIRHTEGIFPDDL